MPRAPIADVRPLANADSLILPFLAPRAFAVSPFQTSAPRRNAGTYTKSQKTKERVDVPQTVNTLQSGRECGSHKHGDACSNIRSCLEIHHGNASSLQYPSVAHNRYPSLLLSAYTPWHTDHRYSDIYSYARAQNAAYSTKPSTTSRRLDPTKRESARLTTTTPKSEEASLYHPTSNSTAGLHTQVSGEPRVERAPRNIHTVPGQEAKLMDRRRRKALASERSRLENFISHLPFVEPGKLLRQGRYRSLCRRIYALGRPKTTALLLMPDSPITGESVLIRAFAALDRKVYGRWQRLAYPIELKHDPHTLELASKIGEGVFDDKQGQSVDGDRMMLNWMALSEQTRDSGWHFLLLYLLDRRPALALSFVQVLAHEPVTTPLRSEMLADALEHIARSSIHRKRMGRRDVNRSVLVPTFSQVFREHLAKFPKICSQDLLWNIGRLSSQDDLRHVFDLLVEHKAYIGYDTLLHFANIFADFGDHKYALRCMSRIVHSISSSAAAQDVIKRERFLWSCALILRRSTSKGQNYHATTEIVADFLKLGVKLDILLYNVIMHNAMEASDHATAFRVYNVLEDNGLSPNKHTYSILLHGCTVSNDPGRFQDFAEHCKRKAVELKNPWLAAEYLYYVYVQHHEDDPAHLSERLRYSYSQFFSIDSVAPFYPSLSRSSLDQRSSLTDQQGDDAGQMEPPPLAIYLVLQAEIRRSLAISNTHVWDLYLQFRHLVTGSSYPALKKLAEAPIIWNAFLLAFCKNKQFANASYLIKGMTDSPNSSVPQPNVYSWNIFMQAFFKNEQIRAAERIYEIMRARGIESDQFTYGVMLRGYARAQHSEKVGEVMGNMENEQQLDPSVLQALTRVHDRKRLMFALEQSRLAKEKEEEKKADAIEADERKRWAFPRLKSKLSSHRLSAPEVKQLSDESESQHIAPLEAPTEKLETSLEPEGTPTVTLAQPEPNGQLRH